MDIKEEKFKPCPIWSAVSANYEWPRNTQQDDIRYVIHGRFINLPPSASKVVRIFMSSTFTDYYTERNCLLKYVYPKLRKLCKEKYDLDFQVVDMRWGIRNEASVDHGASELCMKEIQNCQRLSVGPTFVTLLSHRYGGCALPIRISSEEMDVIEKMIKLTENYEDLQLLKEWYKLDTNAIPNEYVLQSIVDQNQIETFFQGQDPYKDWVSLEIQNLADDFVFDEFLDGDRFEKAAIENYAKLVAEGQAVWRKIEPRLSSAVRNAVRKAMNEGLMTAESGQRYVQSITEEEIRAGIVKEANVKDRCLAFIREIEDVNLKHDKAWRFVEMDGDKINTETDELMKKITKEVIVNHVPKENVYCFKTRWSDNEGINEIDHKEYITEFCSTYEKALLHLIDRGASQMLNPMVCQVYPEVLEHGHQCVQKVEWFHGREDILQTIKSYLMSSSDQPLVIHGESGCGKTSVLAKAATEVPTWLGDSENMMLILRFLGTTPDSSTPFKTLASVSQQLITLLKLEDMFPELPHDFSDLKDTFKEILNEIPQSKRVVIMLDSLDQLSQSSMAHNVAWIPNSLPKNTKLIISTLPGVNGILDALKNERMGLQERQFLPVCDVGENTSKEIMKFWLKKINRRLNKEQEYLLHDLISKNVRPLYLKLVFNEISKWKSYDKPVFESPTIESCLERLFRKVETKHGKVIVSKALGYLTASKNGLTELEIEDILSLDDVVLTDVFEFHIPPVRRLPSILWSRIRSDLNEYIVDRDADGSKVMAWYHRQFIEEARKRYVPGSRIIRNNKDINKTTLPMFRNIADYFAGVWGNDKPKPFQYTKRQAKKLNTDSVEASEVRYVPTQPVFFTSEKGTVDLENIRYNRRKISELPSAVLAIHSQENINEYAAKHICLNQEFLAAWIKNAPWNEISDFMTELSMFSGYTKECQSMVKMIRQAQNKIDWGKGTNNEIDWGKVTSGRASLILQIDIVQQCLMLSYTSLLKNTTYIGADITGRMLQYNGIMDRISDWIRYTDSEGRKMCALVPPHMQLETAGGELKFVVNTHVGPVTAATWNDSKTTVCLSTSKRFVVVSLESGEVIIDKRPRSVPRDDSFSQILVAEIGENMYYLASLLDNPWVYIFDTEGEVIDVIDFSTHAPKNNHSSFKITDMCFFGKDSTDSTLYVFDFKHAYVLKVEDLFLKDKILQVLPFEAPVKMLLVYPKCEDGCSESHRLLVCDENHLFTVCKPNGTQIQKKSFNWDKVTAIDVIHNTEKTDWKITLGFSSGQVCIFKWSSEEDNFEDFLQAYLIEQPNIKFKPKYGIPYFVHHIHMKDEWTGMDMKFNIGLVCTPSHLVTFASNSFFDQNLSTDNRSVKLSLKTICRIKRRYNMAVYTPGMKFILASHQGALDVLKISDLINGKLEVSLLTTIDAHTQGITNIVPIDGDVFFMTSSKDSSLKIFSLEAVGVTRQYIPSFDHTDSHIKEVIAGEEYAITFTESSRFIYLWEIVQGRIRQIFQHPRNGKFVKCATDDNMQSMIAIDDKGKAFLWSLEMKQQDSISRVGQSKNVEFPDVKKTSKCFVDLPSTVQSDDIYLLLFKRGIAILASKKTKEVICVDQNKSKLGISVIRDLSGPFCIAVKLKGEKVLLVDRYNTICIYNVAERKIEINDHESLGAIPVDDLKYLPDSDEVIFGVNGGISIWNPHSTENRVSNIPLVDSFKNGVFKLTTAASTKAFAMEPTGKHYAVIDTETKSISRVRNLQFLSQLQMYCCTPDGKYLLALSKENHIYLYRVSDGTLLACYTMYCTVEHMATSTNGWYVLVATSDRRLFVLIIADPDEREHDVRIQHARASNLSLPPDHAMSLLADAANFDPDESSEDSDAELDMAKVEQRVQQKEDASFRNKLEIFYSSESSDDDDNQISEEHNILQCQDGDLNVIHDEENCQLPAYDGQLYSTTPCILQ